MPELPDVELYVEALRARIVGTELQAVRLRTPFLLRSVDPPLSEAFGREVVGVRRVGKRVVLELEGELFLVLHLMIAGRLRWRPRGAGLPGRIGLAAFDCESGTLLLTEAGTKRRASLHLVRGEAGLAAHDRGGLDALKAEPAELEARLAGEGRTLKRVLCDPSVFSGIGNAYSDEILHRARLSPFRRARTLDGRERGELVRAAREVLQEWTERLREQAGGAFPEKVTAFRPEMAVHGRFGAGCPACGGTVQRIVHAENETNYCPRCQTGGRILKDRALSRLLNEGWPGSADEA